MGVPSAGDLRGSSASPDEDQLQHPFLCEVARVRRIPLGHFLPPPEYTGEWRCDTHPQFNPDGKKVVIDSPMGVPGAALPLRHLGDRGSVDRVDPAVPHGSGHGLP